MNNISLYNKFSSPNSNSHVDNAIKNKIDSSVNIIKKNDESMKHK